MDGAYSVRRLVSISHIEPTYTRWSSQWGLNPHLVHHDQGIADAMLGSDPAWVLSRYALNVLFRWAYGYLSYGGLWAWSIWTMPAILRIFVYQTVASHTVIGSTVSYDHFVGWGGPDLDSMRTWNNMRWSPWGSTLGICSVCTGHSLAGTRWHSRTWMIVAYNLFIAADGNPW